MVIDRGLLVYERFYRDFATNFSTSDEAFPNQADLGRQRMNYLRGPYVPRHVIIAVSGPRRYAIAILTGDPAAPTRMLPHIFDRLVDARDFVTGQRSDQVKSLIEGAVS